MNSDTGKYAGHAALVREVTSGLVGSLLSLTYCFSYGALIFAGPLALYLADGVAAALMTGAAAAILVALMSGFRLAVAGPVSHTAARDYDRGAATNDCSTPIPRSVDAQSRGIDGRHISNRDCALCTRMGPPRQARSLRALSGDGRISRLYRLADHHWGPAARE